MKIENAKDVSLRCKRVIAFLISEGIGSNTKDICAKIGYNISYTSSVITGNDKVSNRFVDALCSLSPRINKEWVLAGTGNMLLENVVIDEYMIGKMLYQINDEIKEIHNRMKLMDIRLVALFDQMKLLEEKYNEL